MHVLIFCGIGAASAVLLAGLLLRARAGRLGTGLTADARWLAEAAEAAHRHQRELEISAADLALANQDLRSRLQAGESFLRSVTHDLRTPFLSLQWFSGELVRSLAEQRSLHATVPMAAEALDRLEEVDRDMEKAVRFLEAAAAGAAQTLKSLQLICRARQIEYKKQRIDPGEIVRRSVKNLSGLLAEKGAEIKIPGLPPVWGDASALEQIFTQLLGNALQYLDPSRTGLIEVGAESGPPESPLTYWVRDNGRGIPAGSQSRLGTPFQRLHPEAGAGEGIGLALVLCAVERHGGQLRVESQEGMGTTVFFSLSDK